MSHFHRSHRILAAAEVDYTAEAGLVQRRAALGQPSVICLGPIVFFSTAGGDAWMIDVLDGEAACLARAGEALPIPIVETPSQMGIAWQARHRFDDDTFVVIENDGSTQTHAGCPVPEIRRMIADYPAEFSGVRLVNTQPARRRLKQTGRNDPCPCGSGRKYKKCCLPLDEAAVAGTSPNVQRAELQIPGPVDLGPDDETGPADFADDDEAPDLADETAPPPDDEAETETGEPELPPEVCAAIDRIWEELDEFHQPNSSQLDAWLDQWFELPPEAPEWNEVFDALAEKGHTDLPAAFRRIATVLPPKKASGASFLYWSAMEKFVRRRRFDLVSEVACAFRRLGSEGYDPDALEHMVLWSMAAGHDQEALALQEHFLPVLRGDDDLMAYAVPSVCRTIFELRVGLRLPEIGVIAVEGGVEELACELVRDVDEEIHLDFARRAARVICGETSEGGWQCADFDVPRGQVPEGSARWEKEVRRFEAMMHVAHEAWQSAGRSPGSSLRGLGLLVDALYEERDRGPRRKRSGPENLIDCLWPDGMESRIALSARGMIDTNTPHAYLLIEAHADLLHFAKRHRLIGDADAARSESNIAMLRKKMGFVAGTCLLVEA